MINSLYIPPGDFDLINLVFFASENFWVRKKSSFIFPFWEMISLNGCLWHIRGLWLPQGNSRGFLAGVSCFWQSIAVYNHFFLVWKVFDWIQAAVHVCCCRLLLSFCILLLMKADCGFFFFTKKRPQPWVKHTHFWHLDDCWCIICVQFELSNSDCLEVLAVWANYCDYCTFVQSATKSNKKKDHKVQKLRIWRPPVWNLLQQSSKAPRFTVKQRKADWCCIRNEFNRL